MKKLMYLFVAAIMFAFTACGGGDTATEEAAPAVEETVETAVEEVAVGCQVEGGTCLEDHSCCAPKSEATCCCGDETCDGSCHGDEAAAEEAHSHDHE